MKIKTINKVSFHGYVYNLETNPRHNYYAEGILVHNCNMACPYCYAGKKTGDELSTKEWKKIIDNLAKAGLFQVTFGGGEPTLRRDLMELARYVNDKDLNLGMTTNGIELIKLNPVLLRRYFRQINVSWHENPEQVEAALEFLFRNKIKAGINYCFSRPMAKDNNIVKELAKKWNAELLYLVYKPVIKDWENQIPGEEVYKVAKRAANDGIRVAVDGPCVNQCMMKIKFVDVGSMGDVFPCSFMRYSLGNLLITDFKEIWKKRGPQDACKFVDLKKEIKVTSKTGLKRDTLVYMKETYGNRKGQVNESTLYRIRSIGEKQATLDRVDKKTLEKTSYRGRGMNVYLYAKEEVDRRQAAGSYNSSYLMPWNWSQILAPTGEAGWDADMNW